MKDALSSAAASATCRRAVFILLLGAPGSGKGTQGKLLAERLGLQKITTGDILRTAVAGATPLGLEAKKFMNDGKLVPDTVVLSLIKEELAKPEAQQGAVLDGFPRTAAQAELVDRTLAERGQRLNHVLLLDVPEEEVVRRMMARAAREGRSDDTPDAIKTRLQVYQRDTAPLIAHFAQRGIVRRVPGTGTVDDIAVEIQRIIGRSSRSSRHARSRPWRPQAAWSPRRLPWWRVTYGPGSRRKSSTRSPRTSSAPTPAPALRSRDCTTSRRRCAHRSIRR